MIKKILHIFLFMAAAFTAVAKNPVGDKNSFVAQVGAFYKAQVSNNLIATSHKNPEFH